MADAAIFRPVKRRRLISEVVSHLRRRIVSGELGIERQLPSMRRLARLYGVSLPTMHAAIHALAAIGFVRVEAGVGVFVTRPRAHAAVLDHAWRDASTAELGMLRAAIHERAPVMAAQAVNARRPRPVPGVGDLLFLARERSAHRRGSTAEAFTRADDGFHRSVARMSPQSEGSVTLLDWLARRLAGQLLGAAPALAADDRLDGAHLALADAIVSGDVNRVRRLARAVARREARPLETELG